jgi:hypothetical protein
VEQGIVLAGGGIIELAALDLFQRGFEIEAWKRLVKMIFKLFDISGDSIFNIAACRGRHFAGVLPGKLEEDAKNMFRANRRAFGPHLRAHLYIAHCHSKFHNCLPWRGGLPKTSRVWGTAPYRHFTLLRKLSVQPELRPSEKDGHRAPRAGTPILNLEDMKPEHGNANRSAKTIVSPAGKNAQAYFYISPG